MANPTVIEEWRQAMKRLLDTDGYTTMGDFFEHKNGEIVPDWYDLGIPLKVAGVATYEDAVRQMQLASDMSGLALEPPIIGMHFYKLVVAD